MYYAILESSPPTRARDELPSPGRAVPHKRQADAFLYKTNTPPKKKKKNKIKRKISIATAEERAACAFGETKKKSALPPRKSTGSALQRATPQPRLQPCSCNAAGRRAHPFPAFNLMPFPAAAMPSPLLRGVPPRVPAADPLPLRMQSRPNPVSPIPPRRERPARAQGGHTHTHGGAGKVSCTNYFSSWASPQRRRCGGRTRGPRQGADTRGRAGERCAAAGHTSKRCRHPPASPFRLARKAAALRRRAPGLASADPRARPPPLPRPAGGGDTPHRPPAPAARYSRRPPRRRSRLYPMQPPAASAPARGL